MYLKHSADLINFLKAVNQCQEDVSFVTKEGDILNLKSGLSRFIFATLTPNAELLYSSRIVCKNSEDTHRLADFLTASQEG